MAAIAGILVLLGCGGAYGIWHARSRHIHHATHSSSAAAAPTTPLVTTPAVPEVSAPQSSDDSTAIPAADPSVATVMPGHIVWEQDVPLLPIIVNSELRGHAGSVATFAVFFYAADGTPLPAVDRNSTFANPDGQLSLAIMRRVVNDDQQFTDTLKIPLREFPAAVINPASGTSTVKVRALVLVDGQKIYSNMVDIPPGSLIIPSQDGTTPAPYPYSGSDTRQVPTTPPNGGNSIGTGVLDGVH